MTADDLVTFHRALVGEKLLGTEMTSAMLRPREDYRAKAHGMHMTGFGFEFETDVSGEVIAYWKEESTWAPAVA